MAQVARETKNLINALNLCVPDEQMEDGMFQKGLNF